MDQKDVIWARDAEARAMLLDIAEFDSRKTGKVNMTTTLHRVLVEEHERMRASAEYKRWRKERGQSS